MDRWPRRAPLPPPVSYRRPSANRWPVLTLAGLAAVFVATGASRPATRPPAPLSPAVVETAPQVAPTPDVDILGVWIRAAQETYSRVRDYQCTFVKRERIDGILQDEQTAQLKVRVQPFSVHMKFVAPKAVAGREAVFIAGRHNGKMRAKAGGALSLVGFITLDPRDSRAMQGTRHTITEAGMGNLLTRIAEAHARAKQAGASAGGVTVGEVVFAKRPCVRIEAIDPTADGVHNTYRSVIFFDKETNLPVRYEAYTAPRAGGPPGGELVECFSYLDCHFNLNLTDAAFNY